MTEKEARKMLLYSVKFEDAVYPLNEKLREAYSLGYRPIVEVNRCACTDFRPTVVVTFFHQNDNGKQTVRAKKRCHRK